MQIKVADHVATTYEAPWYCPAANTAYVEPLESLVRTQRGSRYENRKWCGGAEQFGSQDHNSFLQRLLFLRHLVCQAFLNPTLVWNGKLAINCYKFFGGPYNVCRYGGGSLNTVPLNCSHPKELELLGVFLECPLAYFWKHALFDPNCK